MYLESVYKNNDKLKIYLFRKHMMIFLIIFFIFIRKMLK